jgi:hypothetical protein
MTCPPCNNQCEPVKLHWRTKNLTGLRFGRLVVLQPSSHKTKNRSQTWVCLCDCGEVVDSPTSYSLRNGTTQSCGCLHREEAKKNGDRSRTHGQTKTSTYNIWVGMIQRCQNPEAKDFPRYGAKGITVCDRWQSFANFLADMGERPPKMSIDRIDNNGHYEPDNCRWASAIEQARNRSDNKIIAYGGKSQCLAAWAIELGINSVTLQDRLAKGWSVHQAFSQPVEKRYSHQMNRKAKEVIHENML